MLIDVIFVIEGTCDIGTNIEDVVHQYIKPTLKFFKAQGEKFEKTHPNEMNALLLQYAAIFYHGTENHVEPPVDTIGPTISVSRIIEAILEFPFKSRMPGNVAKLSEGLAEAHCCFETMSLRRDRKNTRKTQRHVVLVADSRPFQAPVQYCAKYKGDSLDTLVARFDERDVAFSIICTRKIPEIYHLFIKGIGERVLSVKNFAVDAEHTVLLREINLKPAEEKEGSSAKSAGSKSCNAESCA